MKLYAPINYYKATPEQLSKVCNGCGAKNGIKVPNTMWGLDISEACNRHDWMYSEGRSLADFYFANAVFIMNLAIIITTQGSKWLAPFRLARATKYFMAVQELGQDAFWVDRQRNSYMNITYKGEFR